MMSDTERDAMRREFDSSSAARLRGLVSMARDLAGARTDGEVVRRAGWAVCEALDADSASISRWERETGLLRVLVNGGLLGSLEVAHPADEAYPARDFPVLGDVVTARRGQVMSLDDPQLDPPHADLLRAIGKHSCLEVPVMLDGKVWGVLFGARRAGRAAFDEDDLEYALALAGQVAAGLAQTRHLERVAALAYVDALTGLANRRAMDERLDAAMDLHTRDGTVVSLVMCDVNGLKAINDTRGHTAGDRLLVDFAGILSAAGALLPGSVAARLGGDEFCLLAIGVDPDSVVAAAREVCERSRRADGSPGVSVGVVSTADHIGLVDTPSRLLRLSDAAQYRAKRALAVVPVVAGRRPDGSASRTVPAIPEVDVGDERRHAFTRSSVDPVRALEAGLAALDDGPSGDTLGRLETLADALARLLDAASWIVSRVDDGSPTLVTVGVSALRVSSEGALSQLGDRYALEDYPSTRDALRGGGFAFLAGDPDADPAEEAMLVASGYGGMVAAGAHREGVGWLLEVFTDEISARVDGLVPVVRALVAVAVLPAP